RQPSSMSFPLSGLLSKLLYCRDASTVTALLLRAVSLFLLLSLYLSLSLTPFLWGHHAFVLPGHMKSSLHFSRSHITSFLFLIAFCSSPLFGYHMHGPSSSLSFSLSIFLSVSLS